MNIVFPIRAQWDGPAWFRALAALFLFGCNMVYWFLFAASVAFGVAIGLRIGL